MSTQFIHDHILRLLFNLTILFNTIQQILSADIGCHNQNRILEVYRSAL